MREGSPDGGTIFNIKLDPTMLMQNVQEIVAKIEDLETDSFAKFYIYGAVLKMTTDNPNQKHDRSYFDALIPAYNILPTLKSADCPLNLGNPQPEFYELIKKYSEHVKFFKPIKGISDFLSILDKMLMHLRAITKESTTKNNTAYGAMTFEVCKARIENYLKSAVELNRARQMLLYKSFGTAFVLLIVLQVTWGGPLLLRLAVNAISLLLAYGFALYMKQDLTKKKESYDQYLTVLKDNKSTYKLQTMYDRFFISSIITSVDQATNYIKQITPISEEKIPDVPCFTDRSLNY